MSEYFSRLRHVATGRVCIGMLVAVPIGSRVISRPNRWPIITRDACVERSAARLRPEQEKIFWLASQHAALEWRTEIWQQHLRLLHAANEAAREAA